MRQRVRSALSKAGVGGKPSIGGNALSGGAAVLRVAAVVAGLYFAQEVLIPLALSFFFVFLLAPAVTRLERWWKVGRLTATLIVVVVASGAIVGLGFVTARQVYSLAEDLPRYQDEIARKVKSLSGSGGSAVSNLEKIGEVLSSAPAEPANKPATGPASAPATAPGQASTGTATPAGPDAAAAGRSEGPFRAAADQFAPDPIKGAAREAIGATASTPTTQPAIGASPANPFFAVALPAPVSPIKTLGTYLGLVLGPLGNAGLIAVFVVFMLLEREGMRDRMIRLVSRGKYTVTTKALNDAGGRISKYVRAQSYVNGSYGLIIGLGLWVIGLAIGNGVGFPSFVLWGLLCAVLRFVPYVGPGIAALFPIALSLAVYPGFGVFAATLGLFLVIELLSNNVMEPWLYGASTGLSTVAIMVAAVFWTWLWGPVGLLLSTPLTVCLVVVGKHVRQLQFLDVLLGDGPALPPGESFYQRLLAKDATEAATVARGVATADGYKKVPDVVIVPALRTARRDRHANDLSAADEAELLDATAAIVAETVVPAAAEDVAKGQAASAAASRSAAPDRNVAPGDNVADVKTVDGATDAVVAEPAVRPLVLCCPSHHRAEEVVLDAFARTLLPTVSCRVEVASAKLLAADVVARVGRDAPAVVVVGVLPPGGLAQARYLCRRLRKAYPDLRIVVAYLGKARDFDKLLVRLRKAGASYVNTSLAQTRGQAQALLAAAPGVGATKAAVT